ncbi:hypothetical protein RSOLAG22IIIB_04287 [Rhizoctonia solani]|uniref:Uncharacterized protein n=1 Tax=Rhizoctonia solani TaxID=456999 RepID=A0A0K6FWR8_9AGAM|nr:hypothetical protein RSOLAG22IIIB_04287 [Rhizoctonia solani]
MAVERCDPGWDHLGKGEHAAYVLLFTLEICTRTPCNILSSSHSFWSSLSCFFCLVSCLKLLYEKGLFYYRDFMRSLATKSNVPQLLCLDLHDATIRQTHHLYDQATTLTFFPHLVLGGVVGNQRIRSTAFSRLFFWAITERLKIDVNSGHKTQRPIKPPLPSTYDGVFVRGLPRSVLNDLLCADIAGCDLVSPNGASLRSSCRTALGGTFKLGIICPSKPAHAAIPKSSCCTLSGARNRHLSSFVESATGLITLCLCFIPTSAAPIAELVQIPDLVYLIRQPDGHNLHLLRRATSTHDARWRAMVIGGTIGSTAGAAILGIGIYLLFRARRRRTADLSRSESQPIEMQPTRSFRARTSNLTQVPRSRPPPRAQTHDTSGGPSSWVAKTPCTPSLASLELQPRLSHPRDINRATHIRASTGSQFTEHFEPVLGSHRRFSGGPSTGDNSQSPGTTTHHLQGSTDPQGSGERTETPIINTSIPEQLHERFGRPRSESQLTAPLPPGAAAPVESVGNYTPPEASTTPHSRIQLS